MQGLALYLTLGILMNSQGLTIADWAFWCYLALFWVMEKHSALWGIDQGIEASKDYILRLQQEVEQLKKKIDSGVNK